ncbi:MAG: DUF4126 domain-containing protein [Deltaproteobacteria bacterium]|nr:DUF4126 domain-containing protein [Deltaproteobacteria bacterium]
MENFTHIVQTISATLGVAWASGINLYAALLVIGLLGATGSITLPEHLQLLSHPLVLVAAGFMYLVEFIADKIPGVDSTWDAIHTFIRIPAGAVLAAGMVGSVDPAISLAAAVVGGGLAAGSHATKAGTRVLINTSPEPFSNWTASVSEDALTVGGIFLALNHPWLFLALLVLFILLMIWLLPKIWRGVKGIFRFFGRLFGKTGS